MIYDKISNLNRYLDLHKNIDFAIKFILNNNLKELKDGINVISDTLFYNKFVTNTIDINNAVFESHKKYLDLHILISGDEFIGHEFVDDLNEQVEYNLKDDVYLYKTKTKKTIYQNNQSFALFFSTDAHSPKIKANSDQINKVVFKILYD
ncbi:YhcH/YjgK/YiaL family protein [Mycoplasma mycoides subsp. capri]|uniref:YhcH/YjgK/YiaL family protein n=1 Tax=Mycoplasma mycoides TaxID=2102 RepID=UPI00224040C9|nr:YhcH/YjgK/YiaL family protein [Mycoplasma mycoides]QVK01638.1 YhcH/YjgK/YiaL family protein [Mycoplasma mycoides subsp. capri]